MSEEASFCDLIRRVRAGDAEASADLVRRYEPTIRLVVRRRLTSPGLRRLLDSMDICQSVLASFFVRTALGQYELNTPEQLLNLLAVMARNKVQNQALQQRAARRDYRRLHQGSPDGGQLVDPRAGPGQVVADRELLHEFRRRLSAEEQQLAEQRALGRSWQEIAAAVGGSPDGLRMRLGRAIERVSHELGLAD
jgi:RNA polymerase sigma-70 factor (ECF subfamily)